MAKYLILMCLAFIVTMVNAADEIATAASSDSNTYCYVCNQNTDSSCRDPYVPQKSHLQQCAADEPFCRKLVQTIGGNDTVVRQCGRAPFKNGQAGCYKTSGKALQHVCTCIEKGSPDGGCNSGTFVQSSVLMLTSTLLLKFLF